jgi:predicted Zn-dependent peptidase
MLQNSRLHTILIAVLFISAIPVLGQSTGYRMPRSEKLLNDLNVLIWSTAGTDRVTIKLRIHNGAAYDQKGKEGTFALLSDILFPEEGIREFFREDLNGSLEVETTYDYVQVTATTRADAFITALETIAPALTITAIDKELTAKVKAKRLEFLNEIRTDSGYESRSESAGRLYGEYPYGRPVEGTPETVAVIDFADLIDAREKFLTADNATLEIVGDVRSDYAYLAARRLFGGWNKSGADIPATFRLPSAPPSDAKVIYVEGKNSVRTAAAAEGFARKDPLYHAAEVLEKILMRRLESSERGKSIVVSHEGFLLKGLFYFSVNSPGEIAPAGGYTGSNARNLLKNALVAKITQTEFDKAKSDYLSEFLKSGSDGVRLDADTYKLGDAKGQYEKVRGLALGDVQRASDTLAKRNTVSVVTISRPLDAPNQSPDPKDPARR